MDLASVVQYATLLSLGIGVLGLATAVLIHRQQVTTQIFLALSARYDELLQTVPAGVWIGRETEANLGAPNDDLSISVLRFYLHVSFSYFLFRRRRIPGSMWKLMLPSVKRTLRSPLFVRQWQVVKLEFETFPEFVAFVVSIQQGQSSNRQPSSTSR
jgi:hypothetical protein